MYIKKNSKNFNFNLFNFNFNFYKLNKIINIHL